MPSEPLLSEGTAAGEAAMLTEVIQRDTPGGFIKAILLGSRSADVASEHEDIAASEHEDPAASEHEEMADPECEDMAASEHESVAAAEHEDKAASEHEDKAASEHDDTAASKHEDAERREEPKGGREAPAAPGAAASATDAPLRPGERQQRLVYSRRGLRDRDVLEMSWPEGACAYQELDFSQNSLTETGLKPILGLCARCNDLRILKLFKNNIGDPGAHLLADFFERCRSLREVHLSHNRITEKGIEALVIATQRSRPSSSDPLWLRVEYNTIADPKSLLRDLEARHGVCPRREACTQFRCSVGSKVHLPFLDVNRERDEREDMRRGLGLRAADSPDARSPRRLPRLLPGRHRRIVAGRSPSARASRNTRHSNRADARSVTPQRRTGSKSRCRRRRERAESTSHHSRPKMRSHSPRRRIYKRRSGSDTSRHTDGRSGTGHERKRTKHRSAGLHSRKDHAGKAEPEAAPREPQLLSQELQDRLNRLLERI